MKPENRILLIVVIGVLMGSIDTTIVLLALPTLTNSLHTNLISSIWVILSYLLVIAVTTTQFGRLGDIYGRSRMFNLGFVIFTVGSFFCGFAPSVLFLIIFRFIQGAGGALLSANSGAIIADTFEPHRRGKAFGYVAVGWNVGSLLGIALGGVLTTFVGWRYIFYINIPIGIVATYFCLKYLKDNPKVNAKIDFVGLAVFTISLLGIAYGALELGAVGYSLENAAILGMGILFLIAFFFIESRSENPLLNLHLFRNNRVLTFSMLASFFMSLGYLAVIFIIIMYLQGVRGLSPLDASLLLVPGYIISSFTSPYMGRLSDKHGARLLATAGLGLLVVTTLVYFTLTPTSSLYLILIASAIAGIGASMFFPANASAIMVNTDPKYYGSTSGLSRLVGSLGILFSFVVILTIASAAMTRQVAYEVFVGTSRLIGGVSGQFIDGMRASLAASVILILIAAMLSYMRGKEKNREEIYRGQNMDSSLAR